MNDWSVFDGFLRPAPLSRRRTWDGVVAWQDALERVANVQRAELAKRRLEWDTALAAFDLRDPSGVDRTSFRMLRLEREEDWSDWLAQLFEDSTSGSFARATFGEAEEDPAGVRHVRREVSCREGWRADIIVEWTDASYTHIEVKVGDPHLDKTLATALAIEGRFRGHRRRGDFILILPDQGAGWERACRQCPGLGERARVLTWIDVARALRLTLRRGHESAAWRVWAHTFCGAIEQTLLGVPACKEPDEWARRLRFGRLALASQLLGTEVSSNVR
ncbi:MAG: hypothetical protein IT178_05825 [Acidobacteria bacterium]|nr:hypothetical protein [Acidobacteriota bacterium]